MDVTAAGSFPDSLAGDNRCVGRAGKLHDWQGRTETLPAFGSVSSVSLREAVTTGGVHLSPSRTPRRAL